jgi:hypothetical protein
MNRYDPNLVAIADPSYARALDILNAVVGHREWNEDNVRAGLLQMQEAPKRSEPERAVGVMERYYVKLKVANPVGAIFLQGRPVDDGELLGIVNVR